VPDRVFLGRKSQKGARLTTLLSQGPRASCDHARRPAGAGAEPLKLEAKFWQLHRLGREGSRKGRLTGEEGTSTDLHGVYSVRIWHTYNMGRESVRPLCFRRTRRRLRRRTEGRGRPE
jgi:hypothetical protein